MASTAEVVTERAAPIAEPAPARRTAPHRLRDLDRKGWLVAGAVVVLLALPWVASYWRYHNLGYTISNDDALIGLRVHDVFSTHPPMVGQPSTASWYSRGATPAHPGPIEFYMLAVPMNLFGADVGSLIGAELFSLGAVLTALWAVFRRAGPAVALAAAVVFAGIAWAQGPAVLSDILSSNVGGIPLLGLAVLAWAVMDGDIRLLPLAAFFFSFVAQQHLAILALGVGGGLWAALGAGRYVLRWRWEERASRTGADEERWARWRWSAWLARLIDAGGRPSERPKPWLIGAVVVTFLAWLPPLVEAVVHKGGNLQKIATYSGNGHAKEGLTQGLTQALRALGFPPFLARTNLIGFDLHRSLTSRELFFGVVMLVVLLAVVVRFWRRNTALALLALTTLVFAAVGAINSAQAPTSPEALFRVNFYRWMFVVSALAWLTIGWAVGALVIERLTRANAASLPLSNPARRYSFGLSAVAVVATVSLLACFASGPRPGEKFEYHADRQIAAVVRPAVARYRTILLLDGKNQATNAEVTMAPLLLEPALAQKLVVAGHTVVVPSIKAGGYGASRRLDGHKHYDVAILLLSSPTPPTPGPGKTLLHIDFNAARNKAANVLAQQARGKPLVLSSNAKQILEQLVPNATIAHEISVAAAKITTDPTQALSLAPVVTLIERGYFKSPTFDRYLAHQLNALPKVVGFMGDQYVDVRMLTPAQVHQAYPKVS